MPSTRKLLSLLLVGLVGLSSPITAQTWLPGQSQYVGVPVAQQQATPGNIQQFDSQAAYGEKVQSLTHSPDALLSQISRQNAVYAAEARQAFVPQPGQGDAYIKYNADQQRIQNYNEIMAGRSTPGVPEAEFDDAEEGELDEAEAMSISADPEEAARHFNKYRRMGTEAEVDSALSADETQVTSHGFLSGLLGGIFGGGGGSSCWPPSKCSGGGASCWPPSKCSGNNATPAVKCPPGTKLHQPLKEKTIAEIDEAEFDEALEDSEQIGFYGFGGGGARRGNCWPPSKCQNQQLQAKPTCLADITKDDNITPEILQEKHSTPNSCYIVFSDVVFDMTSYIPIHPGGKSHITNQCGKDASQAFLGIHGKHAGYLNSYAFLIVGPLKLPAIEHHDKTIKLDDLAKEVEKMVATPVEERKPVEVPVEELPPDTPVIKLKPQGKPESRWAKILKEKEDRLEAIRQAKEAAKKKELEELAKKHAEEERLALEEEEKEAREEQERIEKEEEIRLEEIKEEQERIKKEQDNHPPEVVFELPPDSPKPTTKPTEPNGPEYVIDVPSAELPATPAHPTTPLEQVPQDEPHPHMKPEENNNKLTTVPKDEPKPVTKPAAPELFRPPQDTHSEGPALFVPEADSHHETAKKTEAQLDSFGMNKKAHNHDNNNLHNRRHGHGKVSVHVDVQA